MNHILSKNGFCLPDYTGNSILNLVSSVIKGSGGKSPHASLSLLPPSYIRTFNNVIYLVVDGLGVEQLEQYRQRKRRRSLLAEQSFDVLTSVFPATTVAAVTTFATGCSPAEHGMLSWNMNLHDLGVVSAIFRERTKTGMSLVDDDYDLDAYLAIPSCLKTVTRRKILLSYGHIPYGRVNEAMGTWSQRAAYHTLEGMVRHTVRYAKDQKSNLIYVYWPDYDSLCHEHGCFHRQTLGHLREIDTALYTLCERLRGTRSLLLITADHGLVDASVKHRIELRDVPGLYACFNTLPSGDARAVSCFVRPSQIERFKSIVKKRLDKACLCVTGEELIASGAYGPGKPHKAFENRVGDYVLLARDDYAFSVTAEGRESSFNEANHGGMSDVEMRVPLFVMEV